MDARKTVDLFPELPDGVLSSYRKQATFDWRALKLSIDKEETIRFKNEVWALFQSNEVFRLSLETLPLNEQREVTLKRLRTLKSSDITSYEDAKRPWLVAAWNEALFFYDASLGASYNLAYSIFISAVRGLGTSKHQHLVKAAEESDITGCFALTEVAHGSNVKGMRTTATFDSDANEFVLHSADFGAAKFWVGLLGRFVMFNSYHISHDCLLDKFSSVDARGNYTTLFADYNQRLAVSFAVLSRGRVCITGIATTQLHKAVITAVRYSAVRKQFGPDDSSEEFPILEYQQQQCRILPYLAAAFILRIFTNWFMETQVTHTVVKRSQDLMEIHGLVSSAKPVCSWLARDGIQVCREACGGHGYLKASGFGICRNDNDANCTYEGENSLLVQQTSNWLLSLWKKVRNGRKINTPFKTVNFLNNYQNILISKLSIITCADILDPRSLLACYKWLVCHTLEMTAKKIENLKNVGKSKFEIRNQSQSYCAATLSILYAELTILDISYQFILKIRDVKCKNVLLKLLSLYGAWSLEKHLGTLYMGSFLSGSAGRFLREGIVELCSQIKGEAVALVDAIAPPDDILNSVLGKSDGNVYRNMEEYIFSSPDSLARPDWWQDVLKFKGFPSKI